MPVRVPHSDSVLLRPADAARHGSLWSHRSLLRALVVRNLTLRYQRTALGFLWALLNPLATTAILVGVFGYVLRVGVADYWMFLASGYFAWIFVVHTVSACAVTIREHGNIVRNAPFPTEILVIGTAVGRVLELIMELAVAAILVGVMRHGFLPPSLLLLPLLLVLQFTFAVALALPFAAASVFFSDVEFALPVSMTLLGYLSPVFYPLTMIPDAWVSVYRLNPVVDLLTMFHTVIYEGMWPAPAMLLRSVVVVSVLLLASLAVFRWRRDVFAEVV